MGLSATNHNANAPLLRGATWSRIKLFRPAPQIASPAIGVIKRTSVPRASRQGTETASHLAKHGAPVWPSHPPCDLPSLARFGSGTARRSPMGTALVGLRRWRGLPAMLLSAHLTLHLANPCIPNLLAYACPGAEPGISTSLTETVGPRSIYSAITSHRPITSTCFGSILSCSHSHYPRRSGLFIISSPVLMPE